jgi:hypothetical protein
MVVNQHHNMSHPKVISIPLGFKNAKEAFTAIHKAARLGLKKEHLFFTAGSNYGFRPAIRACLAQNLGKAFTVFKKMNNQQFHISLATSYAVLAMPGLGYDTHRCY